MGTDHRQKFTSIGVSEIVIFPKILKYLYRNERDSNISIGN